METHNNQPSQEESDHHQEHETLVSSTTQARSYECNFCKRGFSNAQALGGHMNIHRKHKANLRRSSSIDQSHQQQIAFSDISSGEGSLIKWPDRNESDLKITSKCGGEIQQLPLFSDKPSNDLDHHQQPSDGFEVEGMPSSETLLDLELRLGPDPQDDSSSYLGTKKFF